jgi:hypothetical protein
VELPGVDHDPWIGDVDPVIDLVQEFLADVTARRVAGRVRTASAP